METPLALATQEMIEAILEKAHAAGRSMLFEHEVYSILGQLGIKTPVHLLLKSAQDISPRVLARFSSPRLVLKAAAGGMAHKQKAGGVRIIHKDLDFVKYTFERMKAELEAKGHAPEGILLVEFIEYSQDLGNEILLGFRESDAFGPVISFSKGGSDAEHFAENFSPPNLILAPIDRRWAEALLFSTKIQKKYAAQGHSDYTRKIVETGLKFSQLATCFSNFFDSHSRFVLREFEVNPFIFDPHGRFMALDGYALFALRGKAARTASAAGPESLVPFFEPEGIAVVGVSSRNPNSPGFVIAHNLVKLGRDDVYCINPKGGSLEVGEHALRLYRSLAEIEAPVELAVVAVPAEASLQVLEACVQKKVKAVILISGGFSETGKGDATEKRMLEMAQKSGMRLLGPNCLGVICSGKGKQAGINTFFIPEAKFQLRFDRDRNVVLLSQSGALGLTEVHNLRHAISPKAIVSYGNQLDVDPADLVDYFGRDPEVDVIGCYIEGFKPAGGAKFFKSAARCPKPVIVYKAGRTRAGRRATESHTASIAGEYEVARAAMKQAGLVVAETMLDHTDFIKTFALLNDYTVNGKRVAIIANAGYEKTYAADNLRGLEVAEFDAETLAALEKILPSFVTVDPLLDLTPMAGDALFEQSIEIVLKSRSVNALLVSIVPHSSEIHTTDNEIERDRRNVAARIVQLVCRYKKPVVVSVCVTAGSDAVYNKFGQTLEAGGVPTFLTANRAMACLNEFIRYRMIRKTGNFGEWLKED